MKYVHSRPKWAAHWCPGVARNYIKSKTFSLFMDVQYKLIAGIMLICITSVMQNTQSFLFYWLQA